MSDTFDVIVIGAGAAGATLATRLSERRDLRVLLLEAGSAERDPVADQLANVTFAMTARDWGLTAQATPGRTLEFPQGRAAGGGSAVNMALALRPLPEDLDAWAAEGNPGWSWHDVLPALRRLEDDPGGVQHAPAAHGTGQSRAFLAGCVHAGLAEVVDHNDGTATGVGSFPMNRRNGERVSTAIGYLFPNATRENLVVRGGVLVDRVVVEGGRARGVEVVDAGGGRSFLEADRVVVAAGAIQSPAVLMRSGIGDAAAVGALGIAPVVDLPGVGRNLMEHPGAFLFVVPADGVCDTSEVQFQLGVRTTAPGSPYRNDLLLGMMNHWDLRSTPDFRDLVGADVIFALTCGVLLPKARGSVTLTSADPSASPDIDLALCGHPDDTARLVAALRLQHRIARSPAMRDRIAGYALIDPAVFETDDDTALATYVEQVCAPWYHPSGTCRMGPDPRAGAVVDAGLRVHGIDGLFVADASIIPVIPRATTNLTAIAIGERAAELLG
jgi:choline dehydrogenase